MRISNVSSFISAQSVSQRTPPVDEDDEEEEEDDDEEEAASSPALSVAPSDGKDGSDGIRSTESPSLGRPPQAP